MKSPSTLGIATLITLIILFWGVVFLAINIAINDQHDYKQEIINNTVITIGNTEPCIRTFNLGIWDSMNTLEVYRWVTECEDNLHKP